MHVKREEECLPSSRTNETFSSTCFGDGYYQIFISGHWLPCPSVGGFHGSISDGGPCPFTTPNARKWWWKLLIGSRASLHCFDLVLLAGILPLPLLLVGRSERSHWGCLHRSLLDLSSVCLLFHLMMWVEEIVISLFHVLLLYCSWLWFIGCTYHYSDFYFPLSDTLVSLSSFLLLRWDSLGNCTTHPISRWLPTFRGSWLVLFQEKMLCCTKFLFLFLSNMDGTIMVINY